MADMLTTVLVVASALTVAGWWLDWLDPRWIAVAVGGSFVPDTSRLRMLLDADRIEAALGIPFGFHGLETVGGVLLVAGVITVWFEREHWRRVYGLLVTGGLGHLVLDGLRIFADGRSGLWLFPIAPGYRPPTPNLFVSSDPVVPAVAVALTAVVLALDRWVVADGVW